MQSQVTKQFHDHTIISLAVAGLAAATLLFVALALTVDLPVTGGDQAAGERDIPIAYSHAEMGEGLLDTSGNQANVASQAQVSTSLPAEAGEGLIDQANRSLAPVGLPDYFSPNQGEGLVDSVNAALEPVYVPDYFSPHQGEGLVDRINGELNGIVSTTQDGLPDYFSPSQGEGLLDQSN